MGIRMRTAELALESRVRFPLKTVRCFEYSHAGNPQNAYHGALCPYIHLQILDQEDW